MSDEGMRAASRMLDLFSDADRLRIIGKLVEGELTLTDLAAELGMKPQAVAKHIRNLDDAGLIVRSPETAAMSFDVERMRAISAERRPETRDEFGDEAGEDARILRSFVTDGRLTQLPSQRSRWTVVLRWLADEFDPGVEYPEAVVNEKLGAIHEDYALLRRQLVDEGFMTRDRGIYRRTDAS